MIKRFRVTKDKQKHPKDCPKVLISKSTENIESLPTKPLSSSSKNNFACWSFAFNLQAQLIEFQVRFNCFEARKVLELTSQKLRKSSTNERLRRTTLQIWCTNKFPLIHWFDVHQAVDVKLLSKIRLILNDINSPKLLFS